MPSGWGRRSKARDILRVFHTTEGWHNHFAPALQDMGQEVIEFDYSWGETYAKLDTENPEHLAFIAQNRPKVTADLLRQIKAAHAEKPVDLLFSYFYDAVVEPEAIDEIKALGIKTVNWYANGSYQLHLVRHIAPHFDWCLVPEHFRLKDYKAMGANPVYCQEAANPKFYHPYALPVEYDVTFVGQAYGDRPAYIKFLRDAGIDVRVWGTQWAAYATPGVPRRVWRQARKVLGLARIVPATVSASITGGPLSDTELVQMYSRSKINLGFSTCGDTHLSRERIVQVRLRDFEVPMSGGFYMVEYMEELEEFFEIGKEIVCYTSPQDLADKIKYYLAHDAEREQIRQAGHARCLRDHSWQTRLTTAFRQMGLG